MKNIQIFFWACETFKDLQYEHKQVLSYDKQVLDSIIEDCLNSGKQVMLYKNEDTLVLLVDNGRFRQR